MQIAVYLDRQTYRQTDRQTARQTDRQTDRIKSVFLLWIK